MTWADKLPPHKRAAYHRAKMYAVEVVGLDTADHFLSVHEEPIPSEFRDGIVVFLAHHPAASAFYEGQVDGRSEMEASLGFASFPVIEDDGEIAIGVLIKGSSGHELSFRLHSPDAVHDLMREPRLHIAFQTEPGTFSLIAFDIASAVDMIREDVDTIEREGVIMVRRELANAAPGIAGMMRDAIRQAAAGTPRIPPPANIRWN